MKRASLGLSLGMLLGMLLGIFLLTLCVVAQSAPAQGGAVGHWEGEITLPGTALEIHVDLSRDKDDWQAKIDIPQQGAQGLALQSVKVDAEKVHFELQAGPGLAVFDGKLEGDKIAGTFTQAGQTFPFSLTRKAAGAAAAVASGSAAGKQGLDGLDDFVTQAMKDWKVPGLAIAVVQGDKVILSKGYGYRDMEKQLPVTSNTLFAIGSITKSFTVSTLGMEMDEGKVDWDKPVRDYLPTFKLYEPMLTEQVMIRDLVTHRTGLPRHDFIWYTSDFSREDLLRRLQYLEPSKPLRAKFQYNNLMFMTAGYIAGQLNGTSWEDAITQRVLRPLGMNGTNFSELDTQNTSDFAEPYRKGSDLKAELKRIPFDQQCPNRCAMGPAGEINSNVDDMSKYLLFHMNKGKAGGKQLLSENNSEQMQVPQMAIQGASPYKELGDDNYGMGFFLSTYRGHKVVEHGGNIDGFSAELTFMPNDRIGVVVLTNLDGNPLPQIVAWNVYDRLLGLEPVAWNQRMLASETGGKKAEQEAKEKGYTERKTGTHPSHELKEYVADFSNPGYGVLSITGQGSAMKMKLNLVEKPLEHYHYDIFQVPANPLDPFEKMKITFMTGLDGDIDSLSMPLEPNVKDIVFTRMPDKQLTERSFIEAFAGEYQIAGSPAPLTVSLRGENTLVLTVPGQPDYKLNPKRGTTFELADLHGVTIEFKRDASGRVTEAVLNQLGTVIVLKKK